jgi:hypothetical protein
MWGSSQSDVFAVGDDGTRGLIRHFNGTTWSSMPSPTDHKLSDVHGTGPNDVYAAGGLGEVYHYDGSTWRTLPTGSMDWWWSVWAGALDNVVFAGAWDGSALHWDGTDFEKMDTGASDRLNAVWGASPSAVYAVGNQDAVRFDGSAWSDAGEIVNGSTLTMWGTAGDNVYAAGSYSIQRYNGTAWSVEFGGYGQAHGADLWGTSAANVYAVTDTDIKRFDGVEWTTVDTGNMIPWTGAVLSIHGTSANDIWVVGANGLILHYDGAQWEVVESHTSKQLIDVYAAAANNAFAVGENGVIVRWDGSAWAVVRQVHEMEYLWTIGGVGTDPLFVAGENAEGRFLLRYDEGEWNEVSSYDAYFSDIYGLDATHVYAADWEGPPFLFDGTRWRRMSAGFTDETTAVWAASPTDVFVSSGGYDYYYDGREWEKLPALVMWRVGSIWGSSADEIWMGSGGTMIHYTAQSE